LVSVFSSSFLNSRRDLLESWRWKDRTRMRRAAPPADQRHLMGDGRALFRFCKLHGEGLGSGPGRGRASTSDLIPGQRVRFLSLSVGIAPAPAPVPHPAISADDDDGYGRCASLLRKAGHVCDASLLGASPRKGAADDGIGYGGWGTLLRKVG
jgi:hypothetical protein